MRPRILPKKLALANSIAGLPAHKVVGCRLTLKAFQYAAAIPDEEVLFKLTPKQAEQVLGLRRGQTDEEIVDLLLDSVPMVVIKQENRTAYVHALAVEQNKDTGDVEVQLHPKLVKWVRGQKSRYTLVVMNEAMKLSTSRAVSVYLQAVRVENLHSASARTIGVDVLDKALAMPAGSQTYDLLREVRRAAAEVNAKTSLNVSHTPVKDGRKVVAVKFAATRRRKV